MKDQLQHVIETMRRHVMKNLELIKANEGHIREVLNWPLSADRTKELNDSYQLSKTLLSENNDFINLQVTIMNFLNKYKQLAEDESMVNVAASNVQQNQYLSREDYFKLTIDRDIAFDASHPYYHDKEFFNELFTYFEQSENYEMCAQLIKLKK
jgi:hypothetical protein